MKRRGVRGWFRLPVTDRLLSERDVEDELTTHLDERVERLVAAGMTEADARAEAERRLGGLPHARHALVREAWDRDIRLSLRERARGWLDDVRYALRAVFRERGYAVVVIITLALGIGANATMFGVLDRLLLSGPSHVVEPDELVRLYSNLPNPVTGDVDTFGPMNGGALSAFRANVPSLAHVSGYMGWELTLGSGIDGRQLVVGAVSASFFPLLGVQPVLGRFFDEAEAAPPVGERVLVLSHRLWQAEFGGRRDVIGEQRELSGHGYTIIGVAPPGFTGVELEPRDGWVPLANRASLMGQNWDTSWGSYYLSIVGRLRPGATPERVGAEATSAWRGGYEGPMIPMATEAFITAAGIGADARGGEPMEHRVARWLMAVSGIVLAIACANVANLYFARGLRRRREIAVRLTLGISRGRLVRLLLMESMLLALLGGIAALAVAYWGAELVRTVLLPDVDWTMSPLNLRVLAAAAGLTALAGVITGLVPALQATSTRLAPALTGSVHAPPSPGRARDVLAIAQAAFCVLLLVGAGLFVRSLWTVQRMDLGMDPDRVVQVWFQWETSPDLTAAQRAESRQRQEAFLLEATPRLEALAGVERVAVGLGGTFAGGFGASIRADGVDSVPQLPAGGPYQNAVTAGYFAVIGTRLLRGRTFVPADDAGEEPIIVINRTVAETLWPGGDPLDRCIYIGNDQTCQRVIGVVADVRRFAIVEEPAMELYLPWGRRPTWATGAPLFVRTSLPPARMTETLRRELHAMDPALRHVRISPLSEVLAPHKRAWTLGAALFGLCGLLALAIAAIGLYSVIAYLVLHRRHEIGVRMALGAERGDVVRLILRQALTLAGAGLLLGGVAAIIAAPWIEPLLFETRPRDAGVFLAAAGTLALAALAAGLIPAWRASRVQPTEALRES